MIFVIPQFFVGHTVFLFNLSNRFRFISHISGYTVSDSTLHFFVGHTLKAIKGFFLFALLRIAIAFFTVSLMYERRNAIFGHLSLSPSCFICVFHYSSQFAVIVYFPSNLLRAVVAVFLDLFGFFLLKIS